MLSARWLVPLCALATPVLRPAPALAQRSEVTGTFTVIWEDAARRTAATPPIYVVIDDAGRWTRVDVPAERLRALGGVRALQNARVRVRGTPGVSLRDHVGGARSLRAASIERLSAPTPQASVVQTGSHAMVTILCQYPDSTDPTVPADVFRSWLQPGGSYPGLDNVYREMSYGQFDLSGSVVVGWYRLPHTFAHYWTNGNFDLGAMANDCTAAADRDVDFQRFAGINVETSGPQETSYGTSGFTLTLDGAPKTYGFTWVNAPTPATFEHEIGHTLGWPHSQGGYGAVYDSEWDVMSDAYVFFDAGTSPETWVGQHTIAAHKEYSGWIPGSRIYVPAMPSTRTLVLERLAKPVSTTNVLEVKVPLADPAGQFYTMEARRLTGYDAHLPGEGVILHTVDFGRPEWAWVVDVDRNGDPNDAGAMWTPGEEFSDSVNGVTLDVTSATASGFQVTVTRGWRLQVQASGPGAVHTPAGDCAASCSSLFGSRGQRVTLTAAPSPSATFTGWSGACGGTSTSCTVTLLGNRSVSARFADAIAITTDSALPPATMGAAYDLTVQASAAAGGLTWAANGALPPGLSLDASSGHITGVPSEAGTFSFALSAREGSLSTSKTFALTVQKPVLAERTVLDVLLGASDALTADQLRFLDLLGNRNGRFDVGDARAWLIDQGELSRASTIASVASVSGAHGVARGAGQSHRRAPAGRAP